METALQEAFDGFNQATKAFNEAREKIGKLKQKEIGLRESLPNLERVMQKMETDKKKAFDLYVSESISKLELDEAKAAFEKAQQAYQDTVEMIEAVARSIRQGEGDIPRLSDKLGQASRKMWRIVMEDLRAEIKELVGDKMIKAFAAGQMCGAEIFSSFAASIFDGNTQPEVMKAIREQLTVEYFGAAETK